MTKTEVHKLFIKVLDGSDYEIPYNENFTGKQVKIRIKALMDVTLSTANVLKDSKFLLFIIYVFSR
jgi:hypothetical protein